MGRPLVHTDDLDELVSEVTDLMSTHTVAPADAGGFIAEVFGFHLPGLSLLEMDYGMAVRVTAEPLPGYVAVSMPLAGSLTASHQGRRFEAVAGRSAVMGTPASRLVMDWEEALRLLVIRVDLEALQSFAARLVTAQLEKPDLQFDPVMDAPETTAVLGQARLMQQVLADGGTGAVNPLVTAQLREQVMSTLLLGQPNNWTSALRHRPETAPRTTISEAADLMQTHADEPLTIEGVARAVDLSVRALHAGFRRELDRSPKQYLQQVRLERARADLVAAEAGSGVRVIDIAHRWGFSHPGRFATAYRHHYGEAPAITLSRRLR
ncbi:AraC family transcriptional regulator [Actinomycetospora aeridis]|uniref:AraC family transcriptional regulator n=1 Tax=Actinomycetospora aeridis TaxID=3129231 RepID=A0ABU8NFR6_9PSEU